MRTGKTRGLRRLRMSPAYPGYLFGTSLRHIPGRPVGGVHAFAPALQLWQSDVNLPSPSLPFMTEADIYGPRLDVLFSSGELVVGIELTGLVYGVHSAATRFHAGTVKVGAPFPALARTVPPELTASTKYAFTKGWRTLPPNFIFLPPMEPTLNCQRLSPSSCTLMSLVLV